MWRLPIRIGARDLSLIDSVAEKYIISTLSY
jgi:hypothetical protein